MKKHLHVFLTAIILLFIFPTYTPALASPQYFISEEVGPCLTSGGNPKACDPNKADELLLLNNTHNLRNPWAGYNINQCSAVPVLGELKSPSLIEFTTNTNKKFTGKISLRDLGPSDVLSLSSIGTATATQGELGQGGNTTLQDSSPKPIGLVDLPYWTENAGSNAAGSRNGILFEFFDEFNQPFDIYSFGLWMGDLETRTDIIPAFVRLYDKNGSALSENIEIRENELTDLTQCGSSTSAGRGCGNHSTRWVGFANQNAVQKVLIVVGEDDPGADGSREHLSFTGVSITTESSCGMTSATPSPTVLPSPTSTLTATPTVSMPSPSATSIPITPSTTVVPSPTPTSNPTASPTVPSLTATPTIFTTVTLPKHIKSCKLPAKVRIEKKIVKKAQFIKMIAHEMRRKEMHIKVKPFHKIVRMIYWR